MSARKKAFKKNVRTVSPEVLAKAAIKAVKLKNNNAPPYNKPSPIMLYSDATRVATQTFSMQARLILRDGGLSENRFLAHVPIVITTVPELPEVVICEDRAFVLTNKYPLTYTSVYAAKATRL